MLRKTRPLHKLWN